MTGLWRFAASTVVSTVLAIETATLICVPLGLGPNWWIAACLVFGILWSLAADRLIDYQVAAWKQLRDLPTLPARDGDGATLLVLFAMHDEPVHLIGPVLVLSPHPNVPSWLRPLRCWRLMSAWVWRNAELVAEAGRLTEDGLLQCTERARGWDGMSLYEITGLGRDVAARNAEVLMAGRTEETA